MLSHNKTTILYKFFNIFFNLINGTQTEKEFRWKNLFESDPDPALRCFHTFFCYHFSLQLSRKFTAAGRCIPACFVMWSKKKKTSWIYRKRTQFFIVVFISSIKLHLFTLAICPVFAPLHNGRRSHRSLECDPCGIGPTSQHSPNPFFPDTQPTVLPLLLIKKNPEFFFTKVLPQVISYRSALQSLEKRHLIKTPHITIRSSSHNYKMK